MQDVLNKVLRITTVLLGPELHSAALQIDAFSPSTTYIIIVRGIRGKHSVGLLCICVCRKSHTKVRTLRTVAWKIPRFARG